MRPIHVGAFLRWGAERWTVGSLSTITAAIGNWHRAKVLQTGGEAPNFLATAEGALWVAGARKLAARRPGARPTRRAPALSRDLLRTLLQWLAQQERRHPHFAARYQRDAAWLVLGFFGLLRRAELGALRVRDIRVSAAGVSVRVVKGKTSQLCAVWVDLPGETQSGFDIRGIVARWLATRAGLGGDEGGALFTRWQYGGAAPARGRMTAAALGGKGQALVDMFKTYISTMVAEGIIPPPTVPYTGHSLRRGGATALHEAGWSPEEIQAHGRWTSDAYKIYIERGDEQRRDIVRRL